MRGGVAALADVIPITPAPEPARFLQEAIRVVYSWPQTGPYSNDPMRRRIADFLANAPANGEHDDVPVPLTAALWSQILRKSLGPESLVGAILADRSAAMVCYGLAGLDDETLQFFAEHPAIVSRLVERTPAAFAAFGEALRIHGGRVVAPGGEGGRTAWESVVGEKLDRPERFVPQLFEEARGRVAYLFDVLSHVDPSIEASIFAARTGDGLKRLDGLTRRAFADWDVAAAPFVRPPSDLGALVARLHTTTSVADVPLDLGAAAFWQRVFDETPNAPGSTDLAWLAEEVLAHPVREREQRLDLFGFVQRVFGASDRGDDVVTAARAFTSYPALLLTLERMGVRDASIYTAAAQQAAKLTSLDMTRGPIALNQFQGAVALVARLTRVRAIDVPAAQRLASELFALRLEDSRYDGKIAVWLAALVDRLRASQGLSAATGIDDVILSAAAGRAAGPSAARLEWEGQRYRVDPGAAELQRLRLARQRQNAITFSTALGVRTVVRQLTMSAATLDGVREAAGTLQAAADEIALAELQSDESIVRSVRDAAKALAAIKRPADLGEARRAVAPLGLSADALLGQALVSLAYACDLGDPEGTILIAGDPARRHDYGYDLPGRDSHARAMWIVASIETRHGPWHLVGSTLALDLAMAPLALRRISADRVPDMPMLNLMHRDGFAAAVAVMNAAALTDGDRDRIAELIDRGRQRVAAATAGRGEVAAIAHDVDLDGWRTRALDWTLAHDSKRAASLFSLTELLVLGGGRPSSFDPWGVYAFRTAGCFCSRLPEPGAWRHWWGLSQSGLPAILVADLPLNVAVVLHNLHLPAALAKPVLAAAMQDFVDDTNPTDGNDWLTLARAAQAVERTRFEDYIASAAADGPLVAESDDR